MDEDGLTHGELRSRHEGLPHRPADECQACRLEVAEILWLPADQIDVSDVLFGIRTVAAKDLGCVVDLVANAELGHLRTDFLDHAGDVVSDDRGERDVVCVVSATDLKVERVDGGRVDAHPHLAGLDIRYGDGAQFESVGTAETGEDDGLHGVSNDQNSPSGVSARPRPNGCPLSVRYRRCMLQWQDCQYARG